MINPDEVSIGTLIWYWQDWNCLRIGQFQGWEPAEFLVWDDRTMVTIHIVESVHKYKIVKHPKELYLTGEEALANQPPRRYMIRERERGEHLNDTT